MPRRTYLLQHQRRLRIVRLHAPGAKHACRRLQRAYERRDDDEVGAEGPAQRSDVAVTRPSLLPPFWRQVGVEPLPAPILGSVPVPRFIVVPLAVPNEVDHLQRRQRRRARGAAGGGGGGQRARNRFYGKPEG